MRFVRRQSSNAKGLLNRLDPHIGDVSINELHQEHPALSDFIKSKINDGVKNRTINAYYEIVRRVMNVSTMWRDEHNRAWLDTAPKFILLKRSDAKTPVPLSWDKQPWVLKELPNHLTIPDIVYFEYRGSRQ